MSQCKLSKRPHTKSRRGCQTCKSRKIKCDENRPVCDFCSRRSLDCTYPNSPPRKPALPAGSPQSLAVVSATANWFDSSPVSELYLMHHYSTDTWKTLAFTSFPGVATVTEHLIPQLSFSHPFLLSALLGITSAHLLHLHPDSSRLALQTQFYRTATLQRFQGALSQGAGDQDHYEALIATSLLLSVLLTDSSNDRGLWVLNGIILLRGLEAVVTLRPWAASTVRIEPLLKREYNALGAPPRVPKRLRRALGGLGYDEALGHLGLLYTSLREDGIGDALKVRVVTWATLLDEEFVQMANRGDGGVLVLLGHYLAFLLPMSGLWWLEGRVEHEIEIVAQMVGKRWEREMEVPRRAVRAKSKGPEEVARVLLEDLDYEESEDVGRILGGELDYYSDEMVLA